MKWETFFCEHHMDLNLSSKTADREKETAWRFEGFLSEEIYWIVWIMVVGGMTDNCRASEEIFHNSCTGWH